MPCANRRRIGYAPAVNYQGIEGGGTATVGRSGVGQAAGIRGGGRWGGGGAEQFGVGLDIVIPDVRHPAGGLQPDPRPEVSLCGPMGHTAPVFDCPSSSSVSLSVRLWKKSWKSWGSLASNRPSAVHSFLNSIDLYANRRARLLSNRPAWT